MSVSGTKRPPNSPKRPSALGSPISDVATSLLVRPVVGQFVAAEVRQRRGRRARSTNRFTLSGSFFPGDRSTPVDTSTPHGSTAFTASATLSGSRPPARISRFPSGTSPARLQSKSWPDPGAGASSRMRSVGIAPPRRPSAIRPGRP